MGYTHGTKWTDEIICAELKEIMRILKIETMPTHSQIINLFGDQSLVNALVNHGGTKKFANLIGAKIKKCESEYGNEYEVECAEMITKKYGYVVDKMKPRYPYDLLVDGSVKVDTKASRLYINNNRKICFYTFNLEKRNPTCDVFVCYCINSNDQIEKTYVIPAIELKDKTQLSVGLNSKYDKYVDNWDLIKQCVEFNRKCIIN